MPLLGSKNRSLPDLPMFKSLSANSNPTKIVGFSLQVSAGAVKQSPVKIGDTRRDFILVYPFGLARFSE
jgi:hypothetical protein